MPSRPQKRRRGGEPVAVSDRGLSAQAYVDTCVDSACPVAWSRHNALAYAARDRNGACVVVASVAGSGMQPPLARLRPNTRGAAWDKPTQVSFSPCGYTLLAYFPSATERRAAATPPAGPAAGSTGPSILATAPDSVEMQPSVSMSVPTTPDAGASLPTLEQLASGATLSAQPSPQQTPRMPSTGEAGDVRGVLCIWVRHSGASMRGWELVQEVRATGAWPTIDGKTLFGELRSVSWLGAPRQWNLAEEGENDAPFVRAPMRGPLTYASSASLPLDQCQEEQAILVVCDSGQISLLHRRPDAKCGGVSAPQGASFTPQVRSAPPFRLYHTWLHQPSSQAAVAPLDLIPPPELQPIEHVAYGAVAEEPLVLVAYTCRASVGLSAPQELVHLAEVRVELDEDAPALDVSPLEPVPLEPPSIFANVEACPPSGSRTLTSLAWTQPRSSDGASTGMRLLIALALPDVPGTHLSSWLITRGAREDASLSPSFAALAGQMEGGKAAGNEELEPCPTWRASAARARWLPDCIVGAIQPAEGSSPFYSALTVLCVQGVTKSAGGTETWLALDARTLEERPYATEASVPPGAQRHSCLALSPAGALAVTLLPSGAPTCIPLPLPLPTHDEAALVTSAGRLIALAVLRRVDCADVALWTRAHAGKVVPDALPAVLREASACLQLHEPSGSTAQGELALRTMPSVRHTVWLLQLLSVLLKGAPGEAVQQLRRRTSVVLDAAAVYTALCHARTDENQVAFAKALAASNKIRVSFAPGTTWRLLGCVRQVYALLEDVVRSALFHATPFASDAPDAGSEVLQLMALPEPCRMVTEVLGGMHLFLQWVQNVSTDEWVRMVDAYKRESGDGDTPGAAPAMNGADPQLVAGFTAALEQLDLARAAARDAGRDAPVNLGAAAVFFSSRMPERRADSYWTSLFGVQTAPSADAVRSLSVELLEPRHAVVQDRLRLALRPADFLQPSYLMGVRFAI